MTFQATDFDGLWHAAVRQQSHVLNQTYPRKITCKGNYQAFLVRASTKHALSNQVCGFRLPSRAPLLSESQQCLIDRRTGTSERPAIPLYFYKCLEQTKYRALPTFALPLMTPQFETTDPAKNVQLLKVVGCFLLASIDPSPAIKPPVCTSMHETTS